MFIFFSSYLYLSLHISISIFLSSSSCFLVSFFCFHLSPYQFPVPFFYLFSLHFSTFLYLISISTHSLSISLSTTSMSITTSPFSSLFLPLIYLYSYLSISIFLPPLSFYPLSQHFPSLSISSISNLSFSPSFFLLSHFHFFLSPLSLTNFFPFSSLSTHLYLPFSALSPSLRHLQALK